MTDPEKDLEDRLSELERIAASLEPSAEARGVLRDAVIAYTEKFIEEIYTLPAYNVTGDKGREIYASPISEGPMPVDEVLRLFAHAVDRPGLNPASHGHLGYIPGGGIYASAVADYLADITNRYAGIFYGGPGAVRLENMLIAWMASLTGYPAGAGGNLTSGGSIANLIGIVAARDAKGIGSRDVGRSVIYLTDQAHHSVDKAIRIAGLAECPLRRIPVTPFHRMDASLLELTMKKDRASGLRPFLVIGSAGTTDTGAVDPLANIADLAEAHDCWFHCDGAYGAFFILCSGMNRILSGMERSDSLVMDPHKGLFLPYGTGAVLVRDRRRMHDSFRYNASYLLDAMSDADELSPADLSPELTKHFRGLRLWLPLKIHGLRPFRACLEEKLLLARYFWEKIRECDGFEAGPQPDLSVVTYRYVPKRGNADEFNKVLIEKIQNDGRIFLSSTRLGGNFVLRLAVLAFRTHRWTIDLTLKLLTDYAREIEREF